MDRFIVFILQEGTAIRTDLKSNMDRFIESDIASTIDISPYLKSNMDRFIVQKRMKRKNTTKI